MMLPYTARQRRACAAAAIAAVVARTCPAAGAGPVLMPTPEFCAAVSRIVDASRQGFDPITGAPRAPRLGMWNATVVLPGALDCLVYGPPLRWYSCGVYVGDDGDAADRAYNDAVNELRQCLGRGWSVRRQVDGLGAEARVSDGGNTPLFRVVMREERAAGYGVDVLVETPRPVAPRPASVRRRGTAR
jgi:hypothetical protein